MPQQKPKNDYDELSREIERDVRQAVEAVGAALRGVASGAQSAFGKDAAGDVAGALGGAARRAGQAFGSAAGAAAQGFRAAAQPARRAAEKKRRLKKLRGRRESAAIAAGGHLAMGALFTALAVTTAIEDGWAGAAAGRTCRGGSRAHGERSVRELFAGAGRRKGVHPRQRGVR